MEDITFCSGLKQGEDFALQDSRTQTTPAMNQLQTVSRNNRCCRLTYQIEGVNQNHCAPNLRFNVMARSVSQSQGQEACIQSLAAAKGDRSCFFGSEEDSSIEFLRIAEAALNQAVGMKNASSDSLGPKVAKKHPLHGVIRKIEETPDYLKALNRYLLIDWAQVTGEDFQRFATESLLSSAALQTHISKQLDFSSIVKLAASCFDKIVFDQFGCQVLRLVIMNSPYLVSAIREFIASKAFPALCTHQFASKVIQTAAEIDKLTRQAVLARMIDHWDRVKPFLSTLYLFRKILTKIQNTDPNFLRLTTLFCSRCHRIFEDRYDKRFLANFVVYCSRNQLAMIYKLSAVETAIHIRSTDRHVVSTFLAFIHKRYKKAEDLLIHLLHQRPTEFPVLRRLLQHSVHLLRSSVLQQITPLLQFDPSH